MRGAADEYRSTFPSVAENEGLSTRCPRAWQAVCPTRPSMPGARLLQVLEYEREIRVHWLQQLHRPRETREATQRKSLLNE